MQPKPRSIAVFVIVLASARTAVLAQGAGKPPLPDWTPTEAQVRSLGAEVRIDDWSIHPPRDSRHKVTPAGNETRYVWANAGGGLVVTKTNVPSAGVDLDQALAKQLDLMKSRATNLVANPIEHGKAGGITYARVRFAADSIPGVQGKGLGFLYLTGDGKTITGLTGVGKPDAIATLETSAQTLRFAK